MMITVMVTLQEGIRKDKKRDNERFACSLL